MSLAVIGKGHALATAVADVVDGAVAVEWGAPDDVSKFTQLMFVAPEWSSEPATPEAVLDDLDVLWQWLNPWVPFARERRAGAILYATSVDGICGTADHVLLAQRDSAMLAQARAMAMELGRFGIRSNCLACGPLAEFEDAEGDDLVKNPLRRVGTWRDAAQTAKFLLSDGAAHVSGQLLVCAGGADIGRIVP